MKIAVYNQEGKKTDEKVTLPADIFAVKIQPTLVQQAVEVQRSRMRRPVAHTKTRSERRGGGAKPWRQKGTGRARAGSRRSPLWRKGGVTFGPRKVRNFVKKMNRKARRKAILMVLSDRARAEEITVIKKLKLNQGKTKEILDLIRGLPLKRKPLILLAQSDDLVWRAVRNLPQTKALVSHTLNILDLVDHDSILLTRKALKVLEKTYRPK